MVAMITGATAFAISGEVVKSLWMTLDAWFLAVGGFSLDFHADRDLDIEGPRAAIRHNPLADGSLTPVTGLTFSTCFLIASLAIIIIVAPCALLPWFAILAIVTGLALHTFEQPLARGLTLGPLQGFYALMGATSSQLSSSLILLAGMFFFAMVGGRGMIDIRDFLQDKVTRVQTLPKRYGEKRTAQFTAACLLTAYALSLAAYFTGEFNIIYLYLDLIFVIVGLVCGWLFATRPSPRLAYNLTLVFMMGMGTVICLVIVLGSI